MVASDIDTVAALNIVPPGFFFALSLAVQFDFAQNESLLSRAFLSWQTGHERRGVS